MKDIKEGYQGKKGGRKDIKGGKGGYQGGERRIPRKERKDTK